MPLHILFSKFRKGIVVIQEIIAEFVVQICKDAPSVTPRLVLSCDVRSCLSSSYSETGSGLQFGDAQVPSRAVLKTGVRGDAKSSTRLAGARQNTKVRVWLGMRGKIRRPAFGERRIDISPPLEQPKSSLSGETRMSWIGRSQV